jgi:hypothetical protein
MLKEYRQKIVNNLWQRYRETSSQLQVLEPALHKRGIDRIYLDHFAVIDLPGPNTGIYHMKQIFSNMGYIERGKDYLAEKQNDFLWMTEEDSLFSDVKEVLPQAVIADFRSEELPHEVQEIIEKYARLALPTPVFNIKKLAEHIIRGDKVAGEVLNSICKRYFNGRDWPLPTVNEYLQVKEFNELLAWVLVFGRKPNHFTLSVHLMGGFDSIEDFATFVRDEAQLPLNTEGSLIKGGPDYGIAQGATQGIVQKHRLSDGEIEIAGDFVEFVWRFPVNEQKTQLWTDYFTGFVAKFADRVIESLYD